MSEETNYKPPVQLVYFSLRCEEETVAGYLDDFGAFELKQAVDYAGPVELLDWVRRRQLPHLEYTELKKYEPVKFIAPPSPETQAPEEDEDDTNPGDTNPDDQGGPQAPAPDTPPLTPVSDLLP